MSERYLVVGLGVSGESIARALAARGESVVVVEESPGERTRERAARLAPDVEVVDAPDEHRFADLVRDAGVVVPSPGVPSHHRVFRIASAAGTTVLGEVELASRWTSLPIVAVTGTNGKTTVTTLVRDILEQSGVSAVAAGNIGLPLAEAVTSEADVLVVEVSSFQLALTSTFRPRVAVWLNVADDHLDAHGSFDAYVAAKARIWANQRDGDLAVVNADDPAVRDASASAPATVTTFGLHDADWHVAGDVLCRPDGTEILAVADLPRALPHDTANALAAVAAADAVGGTADGARLALTGFVSLPHRVALVVDAGGVRWYDDSKATNPHAALAAVRGFDSVVLIAGGRNKGLDLGALTGAADRVRAVVAIGDAGPDVAAAFESHGIPVQVAASMDAAVHFASRFARAGDAVLLSPGCASFDWYANYAERGDDFARAVRRLVGSA